ncbi:hypothetical protein [Paenibacillus sp. AR247]|uniref:hypothetical protein n=1 Tax=Paenibacillus sp. AR247 TaxID=1631599 RepID=UPI000CF8C0B0|nr:hypothetical protein [Paenibacillus sp. AR247]PQP88040.1 hypothetical protein CPT76_21005 [Paenibacillus sp. AR247]
MLSSAMDKPRKIRSSPWIFRRSQRLFRSSTPVHRLAGACVKAYVRQTKQLTGYAQVMSLSAAILLTLPPGVKILVYAALHLLLAYWLYLNAAAFMKEGFVTMLPWADLGHGHPSSDVNDEKNIRKEAFGSNIVSVCASKLVGI